MSDRSVYICKLPPGQENFRIEPFPGSDEAFERGCTCPVDQPWPGRYAFAGDCPVHVMESAKPTMN